LDVHGVRRVVRQLRVRAVVLAGAVLAGLDAERRDIALADHWCVGCDALREGLASLRAALHLGDHEVRVEQFLSEAVPVEVVAGHQPVTFRSGTSMPGVQPLNGDRHSAGVPSTSYRSPRMTRTD